MSDKRNHFQLTRNFNLREFEQHDTGEVMIQPTLIYRLQELRSLIAAPIHITSGYRDPTHNAEVGGVPNSKHLLGAAVDLTVDADRRAFLIQQIAALPDLYMLDEGDHLHVSLRDHPAAQEDPDPLPNS